jgi:Right handed beta helix region
MTPQQTPYGGLNSRAQTSQARNWATAVAVAAFLCGAAFLAAGAAHAVLQQAPTALPSGALLVGPGHPYATPCAAIAAAKAGDTIGIDAAGNGRYDGDVCTWQTNGLTIVGFNGRAHIDAAGKNSGGKGIWVIDGNNTTIENVELSGAVVPDNNGAGIRQEGAGLTVVNCYFHDNQDGILANPNLGSDIVVDSSEFSNNGAGDGYSHNMYIGNVRTFTLRYSWSHDAKVGHLVKSRANTNYILYNRLTGEAGTDSYELDLPNAGRSYVIGNIIEQGSATQNSGMVDYGLEGAKNPNSQLFFVNNTVVNDLGRGTVVNAGGDVPSPVLFQNNISVGSAALVSQASATLKSNCVTGSPGFVNAAAYDYHLRAGSPCIGLATAAGSVGGFSLTPTEQYVHPTSHEARSATDADDAGAYGHSAVSTDGSTPSAAASAPKAAVAVRAPSTSADPTTSSAASTSRSAAATQHARTSASHAAAVAARTSAASPSAVAVAVAARTAAASDPSALASTGDPTDRLLATGLGCLAVGLGALHFGRRPALRLASRHHATPRR